MGKRVYFIRLRRRPRALPADECVTRIRPIPEPRDCCFGGFRHRRITLRSRSSCAPEGFSARRRRRVCHGGTTPACQNSYLADAWVEHFGVQARALPVGLHDAKDRIRRINQGIGQKKRAVRETGCLLGTLLPGL